MNRFDKDLPETTTYWKEDNIFFIRHRNFNVTMEEGLAIGELLMFAIMDKTTKAMVIDNREAKGVWPQAINDIWNNTRFDGTNLVPKKVVTLTNSHVAAMQINRVSRNNGTSEFSKAFYSDFNDEVRVFLSS